MSDPLGYDNAMTETSARLGISVQNKCLRCGENEARVCISCLNEIGQETAKTALDAARQLPEVRALVKALEKWNSVDGILVSAFAALERTQHLDWVRAHWPNVCEAGDATRAALHPFEEAANV